MKTLIQIVTFLALQSLASAQLGPPTPDTSEWNFTGVTGAFVDKAYGPGELEVADGAAGQTLMIDTFTTTSAAGIPGIGGSDATVLQFGPHCPNTTGYKFRPLTQIGSGGPGLRAFTVVYDIYLDAGNLDAYQALLQTNDTNSNDAELHLEIQTGGFWNDENASAGGGSIGLGTWSLGQWNRFVFVNDYDADFSEMYVNGVQAFADQSYTYCYNGDLGFNNWILSDQNCDCTSGWIANFAVVDRVMTAQEIGLLGGADAAGVFSTSVGTSYCGPANSNSTGSPGVIRAEGSLSVAANSLTLVASDLPAGQFGIFINSQTQGFIPQPGGSQGNLCLAGAIGRYNGPGQVLNSGGAGQFSLNLDLTATPTPSGPVAVQVGQTWNFQAWYRDLNPGPSSNFTDAVSVMFL